MFLQVQTSLTSCLKKSTNDAYRELVKCAYEMAMEPTVPHRHFKVLVKCVKASGVRLVERSENGRTGREFVHCIAEAVKEKWVILGSSNFFPILSDGSQARKTKSEKELVLICTERNGIPVYIVASLLEMEKFGGGSADAIVKGINSLFEETGPFELSNEEYRGKLVSCTADVPVSTQESIVESLRK